MRIIPYQSWYLPLATVQFLNTRKALMPITILITDDSRFARRGLMKCLPKELEFTILEAKNGKEAVDLYRNEKPSITFLDLTMPEMDGFEVLQALKDDSDGHDGAIIVLSADVQPGAVQRVMALGAANFIMKPPDPEIVENAFRQVGLLS